MTDANNQKLDVSGLEDVTVAETRLSEVDGEAGQLRIAGAPLDALAGTSTFEEVALRLRLAALAGDADDASKDRQSAFARRLGEARRSAHDFLTGPPARPSVTDHDDPMDALKAALAAMEPTGDRREDAIRALGAVPVAVAFWAARGGDRELPAPDPELGHAADFLRMLLGEEPPSHHVDGLETYLMAVTDHGLNASTFTARVITSTDADLFSAVTGAVGALKGPLHGGAPGPVLDMLDAIETPADAGDWIAQRLEAGERIMGMGHRVYRVRDPRAAVFEAAIDRLAKRGTVTDRLELARAVESEAERQLAVRHPDRSLRANVEFYTAVLLEAVGIPRELFTATFAVGRMAGWTAHVLEQKRYGRLIRPRSTYVPN